MEDLQRYLNEIVDPTIADFAKEPTSVRRAFLACVAVFHSIDYLAFPRSSQGLRQKFRQECSDFATIDRVAHAFKHVVTGTPDDRLRSQEVIIRPSGTWDKAVWDLSRWDDRRGGVTLDNERNVDVLDAVGRAAAFLRQKTL